MSVPTAQAITHAQSPHAAPHGAADGFPFRQIIAIAGAARSGTSWLGQIIDSSPEVAYRFQPFFAYAFQGRITRDSTADSWQDFFIDIYRSDDAFLLQSSRRHSGEYPTFAKDTTPNRLAFKTCRYQYLLSPMLHYFPQARLIGIVRHPAAVINSWLQVASEFPPGSDWRSEWRFGQCKNQGKESEFFGYYKWKEIAHLYLDLHDQFPDRVLIQRYESLVDAPQVEVTNVFRFLDLPMTPATPLFLGACHRQHADSPYAVFKSPKVRDRWREELPAVIQEEIERDLRGTRLERFLR